MVVAFQGDALARLIPRVAVAGRERSRQCQGPLLPLAAADLRAPAVSAHASALCPAAGPGDSSLFGVLRASSASLLCSVVRSGLDEGSQLARPPAGAQP